MHCCCRLSMWRADAVRHMQEENVSSSTVWGPKGSAEYDGDVAGNSDSSSGGVKVVVMR